jgi:hypothetical protein
LRAAFYNYHKKEQSVCPVFSLLRAFNCEVRN